VCALVGQINDLMVSTCTVQPWRLYSLCCAECETFVGGGNPLEKWPLGGL